MFSRSQTTRWPFRGGEPAGDCVNSQTNVPAIHVWQAMYLRCLETITGYGDPAGIPVRHVGYQVADSLFDHPCVPYVEQARPAFAQDSVR